MQINNKEIINKLAKDYNLSPKVVTAIVRSPFKLLRETIREKSGSVRLMYLGIFVPKSVYKKKDED